ncbi:restriction endonuclease subunit S [Clostridium botulinum]|uniref:Restriction endonuclease subunit S n=1 Tax=Clostridium botulinum TaxID=1491 RepID=A0ABD7CFH5_CLOBO|nr:restriction endonuclease subunit S [Clostridium botulinum]QRI51911.1 restriction endonuclease subunit S [Clostridium botulinum]
MKFRYRSEEEMKDSGVEWIGKIPKDWDSMKIKYISPIGRGASPRPIDDEKYFNDNGEYAWTRIADVSVSGKYLLETKQRMSELGSSFSVKLEPDSLFISIAGTVGKPCITKIKACIHDGFIYFHNLKEEYVDFLYNIFSVGECYAGLGKLGTQLNLNRETIGNICIPNPNNNTKQKITSFLSEKTTQFDFIISKKEALIQKLEEAKKSLISEVVTGKVRVVKTFDGYELVERKKEEMKDSGVEWIGDIPKEWWLKKLKYISDIYRGAILRPVDEPTYFDENGMWRYLNISDATKCDKYLEDGGIGLSELGSKKSERVEAGNLILTASATIGKPLINNINICIHDGFIAFKNFKVNRDFLYYVLTNKSIYENMGKSNTQKNIYLDEVKNIYIAQPSVEEQKIIVKYIEERWLLVDSSIVNIKTQIQKLKEAKQSLISEAVTGKIEILD